MAMHNAFETGKQAIKNATRLGMVRGVQARVPTFVLGGTRRMSGERQGETVGDLVIEDAVNGSDDLSDDLSDELSDDY
eukprot:4519665-Prymnesium_polylepis.1